MSAQPAYFNNQPYRCPESMDQFTNPYWNDHYSHIYNQYQNFYQSPHGMFDPREDSEREEEFVCKRMAEYEKMNIKIESEDSMSCDEQRHPLNDKAGDGFYSNSHHRYYNELHPNHPHGYDSMPHMTNEHPYLEQMKMEMDRARLPPFQHPHFQKFVEDKNQTSTPKLAFQEECIEYPRLSEGSPSLGHFAQEDSAAPKFADAHTRPGFVQHQLRNLYSAESNNNGGSVKTPAEPVKNALPEDNRIFPWMKTSFHKGICSCDCNIVIWLHCRNGL